eukprot:3044284-Alexandrium_andersonii.AAC.1
MPPPRGECAVAGAAAPAPAAPDSDGATLLAVPAEVNNADLVCHRIGHGADPRLMDPSGTAASRLSGPRWSAAQGLEKLV